MQLGRNFIGCEIDPKYFAIAEKRIHNASLQPQLFPSASKNVEEKQGDLL
jgi:DNA modification methylase